MESTEKRIPAWAVKVVDDARRAGFAAHGYAWDGWPSDSAEAIARLLVTVREKALREAAKEAEALGAVAPRDDREIAYNRGATDAEKAILSLIDKEPES